MDIEKLREDIKYDEGCVYAVYLDHLQLPTFGIGHLITQDDPEYQWDVDNPISEERVNEAFESDMNIVLDDCQTLYDDFDELPEEAQHIIANMMFNMGRTRLSKFKKHNSALMCGDWKTAAVEGRDSRWYKQVTNRAERLMSRLENI